MSPVSEEKSIPVDKNHNPVSTPGMGDKEGDVSSVEGGVGIKIEVDFLKVARLIRLKVKKTAGTCTKFSIKIEDKKTSPSDINLVYEETDEPTFVDTLFQSPMPFHNKDVPVDNKLYLTIMPDGVAVDNDFDWRIEAEARVLLEV